MDQQIRKTKGLFEQLHKRHTFSIGVHLRRGDTRPNMKQYFTPNQWYYDMLDLILDQHVASMGNSIANVVVHVFTSKAVLVDQYANASMSNPTFHYSPKKMENKKVTLEFHEDDEDASPETTLNQMQTTMSTLARVDLFLMARSGFSLIPGLLNENCVLYMDSRRWGLMSVLKHPPQGWVKVGGDSIKADKRWVDHLFKTCVDSLKERQAVY